MQVITNIFTQKIKVFLEHFQKGGKSKKSGLFTLSGQSADLLRPECRGGGEMQRVGKFYVRGEMVGMVYRKYKNKCLNHLHII